MNVREGHWSVTWPGRRATDLRSTAMFREPGTPLPLRFHFLDLHDSDTGEREWVHVGFEIGERFPADPKVASEAAPLDDDPIPLDPETVRRIASNYAAYLEYARHLLVLNVDGLEGAAKRLRGPGKKPHHLTDDFYRLIASDYEARRRAGERHLVTAIADAHGVTVSAASRWLTECRSRHYIDANEEE